MNKFYSQSNNFPHYVYAQLAHMPASSAIPHLLPTSTRRPEEEIRQSDTGMIQAEIYLTEFIHNLISLPAVPSWVSPPSPMK